MYQVTYHVAAQSFFGSCYLLGKTNLRDRASPCCCALNTVVLSLAGDNIAKSIRPLNCAYAGAGADALWPSSSDGYVGINFPVVAIVVRR